MNVPESFFVFNINPPRRSISNHEYTSFRDPTSYVYELCPVSKKGRVKTDTNRLIRVVADLSIIDYLCLEYSLSKKCTRSPIIGNESVLHQCSDLTNSGNGRVVLLPDAHVTASGSLPVGTVLIGNAENSPVCISGLGGDINCGVQFTICKSEIDFDRLRSILPEIEKYINVSESGCYTNALDQQTIFEKGAVIAGKITGSKINLDAYDFGGVFPKGRVPNEIDISSFSKQLGTLGQGNHYMEIFRVEEIFDIDIAADAGIHEIGQIGIAVHSGSRGLGKAVEEFFRKSKKRCSKNIDGYTWTDYENSQDYIRAHNGAANWAFVNRSLLTHKFERSFDKAYGSHTKWETVSDSIHNVITTEAEHATGEYKLIHRKGVCRALPPQHPELPRKWKARGKPVYVGGSMGTSSYIVSITREGAEYTFNSLPHGAGRSKKRSTANRQAKTEGINLDYGEGFDQEGERRARLKLASSRKADLLSRGIFVNAPPTSFIDEADDCYKNIHHIAKVGSESGLFIKGVRCVALYVIKQ